MWLMSEMFKYCTLPAYRVKMRLTSIHLSVCWYVDMIVVLKPGNSWKILRFKDIDSFTCVENAFEWDQGCAPFTHFDHVVSLHIFERRVQRHGGSLFAG